MDLRRLGFLAVLLVYMIGPNPKVGGAQIGDAVLLAFAVAFIASTRFRTPASLVTFFAWPAAVVMASTLGKTFSGIPVGSDEINNVLKMVSLGLLGLIGAALGRADEERDGPSLAGQMCWLVVVGVLFTGTLGLLEFSRPSLFRSLVGGLYEKELVIRLTNVELAEQAGRIAAVFSWANAFGMFLLLALTVLVLNWREVGRVALVASLGIGIPCLILTNSRIALLLFGFVSVYAAVVQRRWALVFLLGFGACGVLLLVPVESLVGSRNAVRLGELVEFVRSGQLPANLEVRLGVLTFLPRLIANSEYLAFGFPMSVYHTTVAVSPDNQYLGFFVKYGLMAVLLFVCQAWAIVLPAGRLRAQDLTPRRRVQLHTLVLLNVAVALGGLSQDTLFAERWREFYFAFSGVILGAVLAPPRSEGPPSPVDVTAAAQL